LGRGGLLNSGLLGPLFPFPIREGEGNRTDFFTLGRQVLNLAPYYWGTLLITSNSIGGFPLFLEFLGGRSPDYYSWAFIIW